MVIKVDFRTRNITQDTDKHYINIKESVHQEVITILNVYTLKNRSSKYKNQKPIELKEEIKKIHNPGAHHKDWELRPTLSWMLCKQLNCPPSGTHQNVKHILSEVIILGLGPHNSNLLK